MKLPKLSPGIFSDWFRFPSFCLCKCYNAQDMLKVIVIALLQIVLKWKEREWPCKKNDAYLECMHHTKAII